MYSLKFWYCVSMWLRVSVAIGSGVEALPVDADGFTVMPSGVRHRIVTYSRGRVPTLNRRVKFDYVGWYDAFNGRDKCFGRAGWVSRVSDWGGWFREALLSMRVGEVRRIIAPAEFSAPYTQVPLVSILE